jgi:hypothetical protein
MHKIQISYSDEEQETIEYESFEAFVTNYLACDIEKHQVEIVLDEKIISFHECCIFIEIMIGMEFNNPDNCQTVDDLLEWLRALQFISFLDDEIT